MSTATNVTKLHLEQGQELGQWTQGEWQTSESITRMITRWSTKMDFTRYSITRQLKEKAALGFKNN